MYTPSGVSSPPSSPVLPPGLSPEPWPPSSPPVLSPGVSFPSPGSEGRLVVPGVGLGPSGPSGSSGAEDGSGDFSGLSGAEDGSGDRSGSSGGAEGLGSPERSSDGISVSESAPRPAARPVDSASGRSSAVFSSRGSGGSTRCVPLTANTQPSSSAAASARPSAREIV